MNQINAAKYKAEAIKKLASFSIGRKDPNGYKILSILLKADEWVIYEIETKNPSERIKLHVETWIENDPTGIIDNFRRINDNLKRVNSLDEKMKDYLTFKTIQAHIISYALYGHVEEANKQFDQLINDINNDYDLQSSYKIQYLLTSISLTTLFLGIALAVFFIRPFSNQTFLIYSIITFSCGTLGGFISISRKLGDINFAKGTSLGTLRAYAVERIIFSGFAGVIVFIAIECNLIFGFINDKMPRPLYGYALFAVVAGFSETLIPNLLKRLENKDIHKKDDSKQ